MIEIKLIVLENGPDCVDVQLSLDKTKGTKRERPIADGHYRMMKLLVALSADAYSGTCNTEEEASMKLNIQRDIIARGMEED